jgi:hypothetical protein
MKTAAAVPIYQKASFPPCEAKCGMTPGRLQLAAQAVPDGAHTCTMSQDLPARMTDALAELIISETEAGTSAMLDGLSQSELQFLAGALIAKGEERPKSDQQLLRYLQAAKQLLHRAIAADVGR